MMNKYPPLERMIMLADLVLASDSVTADEVADYMDCSQRTARRLMKRLSDMSHELTFASFEMMECKKYIINGRLNS